METDRTDEQLLLAMGEGDAGALEALYARYGAMAYGLAMRITGNRETAEEVVQETFFSAWRGAGGYRPDRGRVSTWLLGITHHRAIDTVRSRAARARSIPLEEPAALPDRTDPALEVQQRLDREAIGRVMASLPSEQRQSIELAFFGGLTYVEIANRFGVPVGTIKSRMRLGLGKLRALLTETGTLEASAG